MKYFIGQKSKMSKVITEDMIRKFAILSGDVNPLHLDEEYAKGSVFKARIAHGILVASLLSAVIANKLPGIGSVYLSQNFNFLKPVYIGDKITAVVEIIGIREEKKIIILKTKCLNNNGECVIDGEASIKVPGL